MGFRSIRWQLQIWYSAFSALLLVGILLLFRVAEYRAGLSVVDAQLQLKLVRVLPILIPLPPGPEGRHRPPEDDREERLSEFKEEGAFLILWNQNGRQLQTVGQVPHDYEWTEMPKDTDTMLYRTDQGYREVLFVHPKGYQLLIGVPPRQVQGAFRTSTTQQVLAILAIMIFGFGGGWLISGKVLRPIREMGTTAREIADGNLEKRAVLKNAPEELRILASVLNESYDHLADSIASQKRFTADASHELRTPVSVVLAHADSALRADRTPHGYRDALAACQRAGRRMKKLVADLLDLSRMDSGAEALNKSPTDLAQLLEAAAKSARALSEHHVIELALPQTDCMMFIDPDRMYRAFMNLLNNAIQHNPMGCRIRGEILVAPTEVVIEVADNGIGFDMVAHPQIFERFYRIDKSRSRENGGSGLGLPIVRAIINAHGGTISAVSHPGKGATFTIRLPRKMET